MDRTILDCKAKEYIKKTKGINENNQKEVFAVLEQIKEQLEIRELVKSYLPKKAAWIKSNDNELKIEDSYFTCEEFRKIKENWIDKIILYMISLPEIKNIEYSDMVLTFYVHMWQNAYLNAARDFIKEEITPCLSFGPGYYGMDLKENEKFYHILDGRKIGVDIKNYIIYPEKTCTGLLIQIKDEFRDEIEEENPCKYCKGNRKYCETCVVERTEHDTNYIFTNE